MPPYAYKNWLSQDVVFSSFFASLHHLRLHLHPVPTPPNYTSGASPPFQLPPQCLSYTSPTARHLHLHLVHFITFLDIHHLSYPCTCTAPPFLHHHPYNSIFTPPFLHLHPYKSFPTTPSYPHSS
ncbi:hypothetical protein H112_05000 [Trichophyton rubrum D6]|uniref:Uncharacterized protein n=3 Tax=Trichophyton TaxID=5550 RepID=A0A080WJR3_TRIRC|nr:uncharacterized protein TERG_11894 [Trichophyton rubrum CBS 118892]EZF22082.1 hypothetical protein H100_05023 [Trichophyton rubrum MR850]EZF41124.1 hypothetical protein H102_05009 [Trichophyton rubrum CBS 100081]EZF51771.1 hypothetical protein H103_05011 [Trichophyton rubrum CBS 288.86]EZF62386.1 hypothetical protein H104_05004 [Trichophyton rubrum CBS 289.86]EZF72746.1 hypothetical protein H105_05029 [Trichophyton soudanense CBS 452.61]EZF83685.1 hypothetical protein H110_05009 [Trichophy